MGRLTAIGDAAGPSAWGRPEAHGAPPPTTPRRRSPPETTPELGAPHRVPEGRAPAPVFNKGQLEQAVEVLRRGRGLWREHLTAEEQVVLDVYREEGREAAGASHSAAQPIRRVAPASMTSHDAGSRRP